MRRPAVSLTIRVPLALALVLILPLGAAQGAEPGATGAPSVGTTAAAEASRPAPTLVLGPCPAGELPPDARCGTCEVFEDRAAARGRKIALRVVVYPATPGTDDTETAGTEAAEAAQPGRARRNDPIVYFEGGPGGSSVAGGRFLARDPRLRRDRDILLVDFRGTGGSGGLFCSELQGQQGVQGYLDDFMPAAAVAACRDRLGAAVDLAWYTSDAAVDDIEEVRLALGYGPLNLIGTSYGTRAALTYLRRHPQSVRTATLIGVVPPASRYPLHVARYAQQALDGLLVECAGDRACNEAFPELRADLATLLDRVTNEPVRATLFDVDTGAPFEIRLGLAAVAQTLRYLLYTPADAALVPMLVHEAAGGNFEPLAQAARLQASFVSAMADGFYQSVTCAEDLALVQPTDIPAAVEGTMLGDFRIRRQLAACAGWPVRPLAPGAAEPVTSAVPTLVISGERDPVTPPADGELVVSTLARGRHLVVTDGAHGNAGMRGGECIDNLIASFIASADATSVDASCVERMQRPPFARDTGAREIRPVRANLERLIGRYEDQHGMPVAFDLVGSRARLSLGEDKLLLIPTSPTTFRLEGFPPDVTLTFTLVDGAVTGARLAFPGETDLLLQPR